MLTIGLEVDAFDARKGLHVLDFAESLVVEVEHLVELLGVVVESGIGP